MRVRVLLLAMVMCVGCCAALAEEAGTAAPATSWTEVGTIVAVTPATAGEGETQVDLGLRIDAAPEVKSALKPGETLRVRVTQEQMRGTGLGDQVRVTFDQQPAVGKTSAAKELARLGRGEFLNPAEHATLDLGPPEAKVLVKMFAPLYPPCHQTTLELLKELAAGEPLRVRVQVFDFADKSVIEEVNRERLSCATVLVNNRYQFTIRQGDRERKVELTHRPNEDTSTYHSQDVPVVVRQEIERIYGPAKPE